MLLLNPRVDALAAQVALIPATVAALGCLRALGLAINRTCFDTAPSGARIGYQVQRIALPRCRSALPLVQLAYDRDALPAGKSQNQLEEATLLAVVRALPVVVIPVILADRGFSRATFLEWLQAHLLNHVVHISPYVRPDRLPAPAHPPASRTDHRPLLADALHTARTARPIGFPNA